MEVLGRSCLSMLSASLNLYFLTWEKEPSIRWADGERKSAFRNRHLNRFETILEQGWEGCPADLDLVNQITLARNRDQHPDKIMTLRVRHASADLNKYPRPFFMSEFDQALLDKCELEHGFLLNPSVDVSPERLERAITETELLASWLEKRLLAYRNRQ